MPPQSAQERAGQAAARDLAGRGSRDNLDLGDRRRKGGVPVAGGKMTQDKAARDECYRRQ